MESIPFYRKVFNSSLQHTPGSWVGSRSDHINTINDLLWTLLGTETRPTAPKGLVRLFWSAPECDNRVHDCTNDRRQGGKVQFKQTTNTAGCINIQRLFVQRRSQECRFLLPASPSNVGCKMCCQNVTQFS